MPLARHIPRGVLGTLVIATLVITLGRGVFITLTVLYFTLFVGLSAGEIALALTIASGVGVAFSLIGGWLADRVSSRVLFVVATTIGGVALASYAFATSLGAVIAIAAVFAAANASAGSVRSTILARAFEGSERVTARATLRTMTNVGITIGGAAAGAILVTESAEAFRVAMIVGGTLTVLSGIPLSRLPARVDAEERPAQTVLPGRSPLRDARYLALTALSAVFAVQFGLTEIGLPLWILHNTDAPIVMVSVLLILNTVTVIALQIRLSRNTHDVRTAGRVALLAGVLMAAACTAYAAAGAVSVWWAIALLVLGALGHVFAEIYSSASTWGLSFELAEPARAGAYQGVFGTGWSLAGMAAPVIVTTAVANGLVGWMSLAALFLLSATGLWFIAHRAANAGEATPAH